ncbi:MAG: hypothetical protein ACXAB7_22930 [Candidatus Kariarchaeaceae archaeon]
MTNSKEDMKKYFFPVYYIWAVISPSIILMINPISSSRVPAFYAIFGLIWPLTFVVYPAFLIAIRKNGSSVDVASVNFAIPLFFIAWLGPVLHLIIGVILHKRSLERSRQETISWSDYFFGFI